MLKYQKRSAKFSFSVSLCIHTPYAYIRARIHTHTHTHSHGPSEYVEYLLLLLHFRVAFFPSVGLRCSLALFVLWYPCFVCSFITYMKFIHEVVMSFQFRSSCYTLVYTYSHTHIHTQQQLLTTMRISSQQLTHIQHTIFRTIQLMRAVFFGLASLVILVQMDETKFYFHRTFDRCFIKIQSINFLLNMIHNIYFWNFNFFLFLRFYRFVIRLFFRSTLYVCVRIYFVWLTYFFFPLLSFEGNMSALAKSSVKQIHKLERNNYLCTIEMEKRSMGWERDNWVWFV